MSPTQIIGLMPWKPQRMFLEVDGLVNSKEFAKLAEAKEKLNQRTFRQHKWYCGDKELIQSGDKTYALRRPWAKKAFVALDTLIENFPDAQIDYWEHKE